MLNPKKLYLIYFFLLFPCICYSQHAGYLDHLDGIIATPCNLDAEQTLCRIDTGAAITRVQSAAFDLYPKMGSAKIQGIFGEIEEYDQIRLNQMSIAQLTYSDMTVIRLPFRDNLYTALGLDLFTRHTVTFDLIKHELIIDGIEPAGAKSTLPATLLRGQFITVPLQIADHQITGAFDTGATTNVIDQSYINQHAEDFIFQNDIQGNDANGKVMTVKLYKIKRMLIDQMILRDVDVVAIDFSAAKEKQAEYPLFIIGANLMDNFRWYFDFINNKWACER